MKSRQPGRLRLLLCSLFISAAAVTGALALSTASSASSHSFGSSKIALAGVTSATLRSHGLEITKPASNVGTHVTEQAAVSTALAQPIAPSRGVRQAALAHVTYAHMQPEISGLFWVVSLRPSGDVPLIGGPRTSHHEIKSTYYVIFISAATGRFYSAMIG